MIKRISQFFKRYWIFIVLATVTSVLMIIRLSQRGQPALPGPQPTPSPEAALSSPEITGAVIPLNSQITTLDFSFPSRLKIYQGQIIELTPEKARKIAQDFKFSGSPQETEDIFLGTFYIWNSDKAYLSVGLDTNEIDYALNLYESQPPAQGILPSPEAAKASLEELLLKLGLKPNFELKWQKEEYLVQEYYFQPAPGPEEADFIKIGANPTIGQYQLVGADPNQPLISLILNKNREIVRFQYQVYFTNFEGQETYDLKTRKEVESTLFSAGRIVYFGTFQESTKPPEITRAEFNQITLAYYQDPEKNLIIQPIYILSGQGTLESGEKTEIITYLPAIKFGTPLPEKEFFELPEIP